MLTAAATEAGLVAKMAAERDSTNNLPRVELHCSAMLGLGLDIGRVTLGLQALDFVLQHQHLAGSICGD